MGTVSGKFNLESYRQPGRRVVLDIPEVTPVRVSLIAAADRDPESVGYAIRWPAELPGAFERLHVASYEDVLVFGFDPERLKRGPQRNAESRIKAALANASRLSGGTSKTVYEGHDSKVQPRTVLWVWISPHHDFAMT